MSSITMPGVQLGKNAARAVIVVLAVALVLMVGIGRAGAATKQILSGGVTVTYIKTIKEPRENGDGCRAGEQIKVSGPIDLVQGIRASYDDLGHRIPGTAYQENYFTTNDETAEIGVTAWAFGPAVCEKTKSGIPNWLKPAIADIAYTTAYVALDALIMVALAVTFGLSPTALGVELLSGCIAGGVGLAINNALLGETGWEEILSAIITGCLTGAAINVALPAIQNTVARVFRNYIRAPLGDGTGVQAVTSVVNRAAEMVQRPLPQP